MTAIAVGEFLAIFSASAAAAARRSSGGSTTSLQMPSWYARAAVIRSWRPVNAMRSTGSIGERRISAMVSNALTWPTDTWGSVKVALLDAIDDVGVGHEVQAAAGADAVDRGDHRLAHRPPARP